MTQLTLADRAGLSARSIQHLEAGISQPQVDTMLRLAEALELEPEQRLAFQAAGQPAPRRHIRQDPAQSVELTALPTPLTRCIAPGRSRNGGG